MDTHMVDTAIGIVENTWRNPKPLVAAREEFTAQDLDFCPMGENTSKGVPPGFYRGVGTNGNGTCPLTCPLLPTNAKSQGPCYGAGYHCRNHEIASLQAAIDHEA